MFGNGVMTGIVEAVIIKIHHFIILKDRIQAAAGFFVPAVGLIAVIINGQLTGTVVFRKTEIQFRVSGVSGKSKEGSPASHYNLTNNRKIIELLRVAKENQ